MVMIDTGIISIVLSIAGFLLGRVTAAKNKGEADGEMKADIKYIKSSVEKQDARLESIGENYEEVKLEIVRLKGRLDKLEKIVEMYHKGGE